MYCKNKTDLTFKIPRYMDQISLLKNNLQISVSKFSFVTDQQNDPLCSNEFQHCFIFRKPQLAAPFYQIVFLVLIHGNRQATKRGTRACGNKFKIILYRKNLSRKRVGEHLVRKQHDARQTQNYTVVNAITCCTVIVQSTQKV